MLFQLLTVAMLCSPTVPMLMLNALKLFSTMTVVLFFTSLTFNSASSARQELDFVTLRDRRNSTCQTMYKYLNSLSPPYLTRLFDTPSTHHHTHASSTKQLNLPLTRSSFGQKAFSFAGAFAPGALACIRSGLKATTERAQGRHWPFSFHLVGIVCILCILFAVKLICHAGRDHTALDQLSVGQNVSIIRRRCPCTSRHWMSFR